jgi:hypothetical protein
VAKILIRYLVLRIIVSVSHYSLYFFLGSSVGLIIPEEADDLVFEVLEDILQLIVTRVPAKRKRSAQQRDAGYSYSISRGIVTGNCEVDSKQYLLV